MLFAGALSTGRPAPPAGTLRIYRLDPRGVAAMRAWLDAQWGAALDSFNASPDQGAEPEDRE